MAATTDPLRPRHRPPGGHQRRAKPRRAAPRVAADERRHRHQLDPEPRRCTGTPGRISALAWRLSTRGSAPHTLLAYRPAWRVQRCDKGDHRRKGAVEGACIAALTHHARGRPVCCVHAACRIRARASVQRSLCAMARPIKFSGPVLPAWRLAALRRRSPRHRA